MAKLPCPLPAVEEALAPYIHTREETARIKHHLTSYFISHFEGHDGSISKLTLTCPPPTLQVPSIPHEVDGLRRRYFDALKAHNEAQRHRDTLRIELDSLVPESIGHSQQQGHQRHHGSREKKHTRSDSKPHRTNSNNSSSSSVQLHISLQRQRCRLRKLQAIQSALDKLVSLDPNPTHTDISAKIKHDLGEPPDLPAAATAGSLESLQPEAQMKELTTQLKKQILVAKDALARTSRLREEAKEAAAVGSNVSVQRQVWALRGARDELVEWVEGELAKLSVGAEEEEEEEEKMGREDANEVREQDTSHDDSAESCQVQIEHVYNAYIQSRASLLDTIQTISTSNSKSPLPLSSSPSTLTTSQNQPLPPHTSPPPHPTTTLQAHIILPLLPPILHSTSTTHSTIHQTTFLRHSLLAATDATQIAIRRLADESHLVPPRSDHTQSWVTAAREREFGNAEFIGGELRKAEGFVGGARGVLGEVEARGEGVGALDL